MSKVRLKMDGTDYEFECPGGVTILRAAEDHGIFIPASCYSGDCGTCHATVIKGEVEMQVHDFLNEADIEQGMILTCQATCKSEEVVLRIESY